MNSPIQPPMTQQQPRWQTVEVGPFRLPGVAINRELWREEELAAMLAWSKSEGALITGDLLAWRRQKHRDWWILRWS
jgi:hypothetical protein